MDRALDDCRATPASRSSRTPRRRSARGIGGRQAGTFGRRGCFSFFPSKNLGAFGDGGLVTTNDAALAAEIRLLRNHGAEPKYLPLAHRRQLPPRRPAGRRAARQGAASGRVDRRAGAATPSAIARCSRSSVSAAIVELPVEPAGYTHIYNQFVIRVPKRDALRDAPDVAAHRHGDLLPGAVPSAGVLRRRSAGRRDLPGRRPGGRHVARAADLRRADRSTTAARRHQHRRVLPAAPDETARARSPAPPASSAKRWRRELGAHHEVVAHDARRSRHLGRRRPSHDRSSSICPGRHRQLRGLHQRRRRRAGTRRALAANAWAVRTLARAATEIDATLVHFSTDFVFDGTIDRPYTRRRPSRIRAAPTRRRSCSASGSRPTSPRTTCCASRACSAARPARSSVDKILAEAPRRAGGRAFVDRTVSPSFVDDVVAATVGAARAAAVRPASTTASTPAGRPGPASRARSPHSSANARTPRFASRRWPTCQLLAPRPQVRGALQRRSSPREGIDHADLAGRAQRART